MFKNTNKEVSKELSIKTMSSHKLRNIMAIIAISLTTLLITTVFTTGFNFYRALDQSTDVGPSPMADGGVKAQVERYEDVLKMKNIEWASYVRPGNFGSLHNKEMIGMKAILLAPEKSYYENNKIDLVEGRLPKGDREILISKSMVKKLGGSGKLGEIFVLKPVILENGKQVEKEVPATIVGIYSSPLDILADTYDEIYITEGFLSQNMPEMLSVDSSIYIKFSNIDSEMEKQGALSEISDRIDGNGTIFRHSNTVSNIYIIMIPILLIIMFCGYLLIYNVFYISVINDIKFFGMLKTIGASGKQLKTIISRQVLMLSVPGILLGLSLGILLGFKISPFILNYTIFGKFYKPGISIAVIVGAILFSAITVWISSLKSYRTVKKLSPIEASKYEFKNTRKKKIVSIFSFGLSSVIFLTLFTVTFGYDVKKMVDRYNTTDVTIEQNAMSHDNEEKYQPIDENLLQKLSSIDTVEEMHLFYQGKKIEEEEDTKGLPYASTLGTGYIKVNSVFEREYNRFAEKSISEGKPSWMGNPYAIEDGKIKLKMIGVPADQLKDEAINLKVLDGELNEEEFDGGGSIIFNQGTNLSNQLLEDGPRAGDVLELSIWDPGRDVYVEKEFKIMAVVESINPFHTSIIGGAPISLSDGDFKKNLSKL
ncbi:ABC-type transport system, involved in lipoprotein release, permease component [Anaerosphaera aminiphila DSM 21120]|uniref:ABC-type transport system, involved in lipoprotein release, permease component n=1 Tax=Anaerosphaera aminiphila DSM 21120 TaxID=1120995 RepID=A0A1M5PJJ5_9FIRM|nr:ABC transporter permease [Anaerosphaera aminiphila]SHH01901.1 ABC-type transport system, involved in lipoprotein release, permease component [Anaerosphaera aminiphila DSM 21120]